MAQSLAIPEDFPRGGVARRIAGLISLAQPVLVVCLSYYAGAWIAKTLRFPDSNLSLIWPPTAILLAALLLAPPKSWWIYLIAVAPVHFLVQMQDGVSLGGIISQLIGNFSQATLAAFSVRYLNKGAVHLNNLRAVIAFTVGAIIFAPVVVSTVAAYLYVLSGWEQTYWYAWRARVLSNALSTLIIVPPIILFATRDIGAKPAYVKSQHYVEAVLLIILLVLTSSVSFGREVEELLGVSCPIILPLPVLLWSAVRFRLEGLCLSLLLVAYFAFKSAVAGQGFFAMNAPAENVLSVQFYLIVSSVPLMWVAALIRERRDKEQTLHESEARYRALVMASAEMVWRADAQGKGLFVTPSWQRLTGQNEEQMRDLGWLEAVHPDDRARTAQLWKRAMVEKRMYENELRVRTSEGSHRHFHVQAVPILRPDGSVHEWVGANVDITERKQAEQALQDLVAGTAVIGEEFFPAYVRHVAAALDVHYAAVAEATDDQNSRLRTLAVWVGKGWEKNYEYDVADAPCGQVMREHQLFYCRERVQERFPECRSLGALNAVSYMGVPLFNSTGRLMGSLCIIDNKSLNDDRRAQSILEIFAARAAAEIERKRAEEALRESEERLARTEKFSLLMVTHADLEGRWLKVPPTLCELLGYSEEELLGGHSKDITHPDDFEAGWHQCQRLLRGEIKSFDLEKRYIHRDGHIVWVYLNCSMVTDSKANPVYFLGYLRDITDRKRVDQALRDSEERLRLALKSGRMGVWDWDRRAKVRKWSKEYFLVMGLLPFSVEPSYRVWAQCVHPDDLPRAKAAVEAAVTEKKEYRCEYRVIWPDGTVRWVVARGEPIYDEDGQCIRLMGILVDVTERKHAEEEIRRLKERLEAENIYLRTEVSGVHRYGELVGRSEGIQKVLYHINQVAGTDMTVMVLGETGTGKELVARAVHGQSARRERPLVKVNCSALPGELIESELFGHEKGAFTGATARQVGRFELADGGTIFLDEVGDLPLKLQAKLLRVLQEGEFERLGSGKTIKVDVRVIAATNRNLAEAMQRGRFRPDLYYRLNVYPIGLPALRERVEDVGLLAEVFLGEASRRLGRSYDPITEEVLEALKSYEWPGNVRELQNVIERAVVISTGRRLQLPEQWALAESWKGLANVSTPTTEVKYPDKPPVEEVSLDGVGRNYIIQVLQQTGWRVEGPKGAAIILGLNPSTLRSRMLKLGIRRPGRSKAEVQE